jgi:hypothetical protein
MEAMVDWLFPLFLFLGGVVAATVVGCFVKSSVVHLLLALAGIGLGATLIAEAYKSTHPVDGLLHSVLIVSATAGWAIGFIAVTAYYALNKRAHG